MSSNDNNEKAKTGESGRRTDPANPADRVDRADRTENLARPKKLRPSGGYRQAAAAWAASAGVLTNGKTTP